LKAGPRQRKWRNIIVREQRLPVDGVCLGEAFEIGKQGTERYEVFEPATRLGEPAARREHCIQPDSTGLIDRQRLALDRLARRACLRGTREVAAGIVEAMRR
jgi:hypothetical protein